MTNKHFNDLLISLRELSSKRTPILLRDHASGSPDWSYWVPPCFNAALDIKLTPRIINGKQTMIWTQGGLFSFARGDTLHRQSNGSYLESLECVQVVSASPDVYSDDTGLFSGRVEYDRYRRKDRNSSYVKVERCTLSQRDFLSLLIAG